MTLTNIISAIGNTRSVYPLILRDCGIEVPSKIYITRKENLKESKTKANDATREKFIDEYDLWLIHNLIRFYNYHNKLLYCELNQNLNPH